MPSGRITNLTPELQNRFFENLAKTGNPTLSAKIIGFSPSLMYFFKRSNPDFYSAWNQALMEYSDGLLEEVDRRGREGVEKPIYQCGWLVGHVKEYSDNLLMFRVKGLRPEYATQQNIIKNAEGEAFKIEATSMSDEQLDKRLAELGRKIGISDIIARESSTVEDSEDRKLLP